MLIVLSVGRRGPEQDVDPLPTKDTDMSCLDSRYSHLTSDTCSPLASLRSEGRQHDDITRLRWLQHVASFLVVIASIRVFSHLPFFGAWHSRATKLTTDYPRKNCDDVARLLVTDRELTETHDLFIFVRSWTTKRSSCEFFLCICLRYFHCAWQAKDVVSWLKKRKDRHKIDAKLHEIMETII